MKLSTSNSNTVKPPPGHNEEYHKLLKENKLKTESSSNKSNASGNTRNYDLEALKRKKAWELAVSPAKNIPMNLIMMYMSPNSLQLIPIMMTLMLFVNSAKEILQVRDKFKNVDADSDFDFVLLQVIYVACCCGNLLIGLWKLNGMGLIPNSSSDWLSWETPLGAVETSFV